MADPSGLCFATGDDGASSACAFGLPRRGEAGASSPAGVTGAALTAAFMSARKDGAAPPGAVIIAAAGGGGDGGRADGDGGRADGDGGRADGDGGRAGGDGGFATEGGDGGFPGEGGRSVSAATPSGASPAALRSGTATTPKMVLSALPTQPAFGDPAAGDASPARGGADGGAVVLTGLANDVPAAAPA